jgi:3-methyladenine DNA glycosylase AlkD
MAPSPRPDSVLVAAVRRGLAARADARKAPAMQAYMKSRLPYRGVQTPALRALCRELYGGRVLDDEAVWRATVLALWREATHREEHYAAIELAGHRRYREHRRMAALPMYEEMIVSGAWWDYVDAIATQQLVDILRADRGPFTRAMRAWARSTDVWKRRSAILCQLKQKRETDRDLLTACIDASLESKEFFLRKGIGWALREYAKTDPAWVRRFVRDRAGRLSPLSQREALRRIGA